MEKSKYVVVFSIDDLRYALPLQNVERIIRAVEVTPLPKAPSIFQGVINFQGQIIPVINLRKRFGHPEREIEPEHQFGIVHTSNRLIALVVDSVAGVKEYSGKQIAATAQISPSMRFIDRVVKEEDGMILVSDPEQFLSPEEETALNQVL